MEKSVHLSTATGILCFSLIYTAILVDQISDEEKDFHIEKELRTVGRAGTGGQRCT
ncbi:hypothetical protein BMS3Bbin11_00456 [bacterium BMS3Bbin11]|nr:hypothetical protein BMS3Bbin11_00456 [bacterium BMS3Bbin11]